MKREDVAKERKHCLLYFVMFSPQKREERRDAIEEKKMAKKREGKEREGPLKRKRNKQMMWQSKQASATWILKC